MTPRFASLVLAFVLTAGHPLFAQTSASSERWVGTWATAAVAAPSQPAAAPVPGLPPTPTFKNQTLRQFVRISVGGPRLRVVLSNAFGTRALPIGGAHVALRDKGSAIAAGSGRPLTFSGSATATIPPGSVLLSDPVAMTVPPFADVAIDLFIPGDTAAGPSPLTVHAGSRQVNYVSSPGSHLGAVDLPGAAPVPSWFFLARVEVEAGAGVNAIVAFGDSITDGYNSTPDTNNRWPDHLAKRLAAAGQAMGVMNLGIDGNRVLADGAGIAALARFDRDVIAQPGVTHVFVLEGINDLGIPALFKDYRPTADELIAGHRQLIARAHAKGLKIFASTLLPYEDTAIPGYFTAEGEAIRQQFNQWMRSSNEYDGVVDFDAVMRDPEHPGRMLAKYDSGDHLHPNDAGYAAMAEAFNLAFVGVATAGAGAR